MPITVLPDSTVVAREALLAQTLITAEVDTRIRYAIPETEDYPLLVVSSVDDDELRPETLAVRVQIDVWGSGKEPQDVLDCKEIARKIRACARDLNGDWTAGKIRNCVAGQIIPNPDITGGRARFVVDLTFELNA